MENNYPHLKYYIGCVVQTDTKRAQGKGKPFKLAIGSLVDYDIFGEPLCGVVLQGEGEMELYSPDRIKPILRRLSDMTKDEMSEFKSLGEMSVGFDLKHPSGSHDYTHWFCPTKFDWALEKGFDLFQLIDRGLAVDATKLKTGSADR